MKLLLPISIVTKLKRELRGRRYEIGGILVGENLGSDTFRLADISFQASGGTIAHFHRDPEHHKPFLDQFFRRTGNDYTKFNYIGEWHSHPLFRPLPSGEDMRTMDELVSDPVVGVNFAVLMIVRLDGLRGLQLSATLFRLGCRPEPIDVAIEGSSEGKRSLWSKLLALVRG